MSTQFDKELENAIDAMLSEQVIVGKIGQKPYDKAKEAIKKAVEVHIIGNPLTYTSLDLDAVDGSYDEAFEQGSEKTVSAQRKHLYGEDK